MVLVLAWTGCASPVYKHTDGDRSEEQLARDFAECRMIANTASPAQGRLGQGAQAIEEGSRRLGDGFRVGGILNDCMRAKGWVRE